MDELVSQLVEVAMRSANINVESLSETTGIARVTLRRRLKEGASFTVNELDRIATALEVDFLDLVPPRGSRRVAKAVNA